MHAFLIHFGSMSLTLLFGAVQGIVVLSLLLFARRNRIPNLLLAGLLGVTVLRILPFIAGYAGLYDQYPWLSFAPYNIGLAFGPLVYLYVATLTRDSLPRYWWVNLSPAVLEFSYYCVLFVQPVSFKNYWDGAVQRSWASHLEQTLTLLSAAVYLVLSGRRYRAYQQWLANNVSFREEFRILWVRNFLVAFSLLLLIWFGFAGYDRAVRPLNYFEEFPLYIAFTLFVYYLGLEGWRHSGDSFPHESSRAADHEDDERAVSATPEIPSGEFSSPDKLPSATSPNWQDMGRRWLDQMKQRELWRDPDLTLASLARELGTNTSYLSKALNEGIGQNFNECINRLRVQAIEATLQQGGERRDLLSIALETGFRSKASFNRAFKAYTGQTPTEYRSVPAELRLKS
jgi:AraC-like DNA-binding protein